MTLSTDAQALLRFIKEAGRPPFETIPYDEAREIYRRGRAVLQPAPEPVAEVRNVTVVGPEGELPARLYRGIGTGPGELLPGLVFFHGGGWVVGDLDTHDGPCRWLANAARCAVVAVEYRLAPEHPFPAAPEDAIAATRHIATHAHELGIDAARLAVGGDSAGGNLAAVVAIDARENGPKLRFQLLIYPAADFTTEYASYGVHTEGLPLTTRTMLWFRDHYLGPQDYADWRASPLRAPDHRGLPPAYVLTAGYDPLLSEGEAYVTKLKAAGVPVTHRHLPHELHGLMTMGAFIRAAEPEVKAAGAALAQALRTSDPEAEALR